MHNIQSVAIRTKYVSSLPAHIIAYCGIPKMFCWYPDLSINELGRFVTAVL